RHAMRVIGPSVQQFERFAEVLPRLARHLQFFGRFEDTAKGTATTEVSAAELLAGNAKADRLAGLLNDRIAFQSIEARAGQVQDFPPRDSLILLAGVKGRELIVDLPRVLIAFRRYLIGQHWIHRRSW